MRHASYFGNDVIMSETGVQQGNLSVLAMPRLLNLATNRVQNCRSTDESDEILKGTAPIVFNVDLDDVGWILATLSINLNRIGLATSIGEQLPAYVACSRLLLNWKVKFS